MEVIKKVSPINPWTRRD